jgi:peptidoglycan/LPS O-acetylase OafA/YrhL
VAQVHDKPGYRDDLDGLRGLAIALVAGYHVWGGRVSGGVDAFLALSGFFLAVSVLSRTSSSSSRANLDALGALRMAVTQWRRMALRLLPSAIVVISASAIATWALLPRSRWLETAQQSIASLLYVENWHLARNRLDYNAADLAVSPLQHFWSLSVQGQLFVVLPLVWLIATLAVRGSADAVRVVDRSERPLLHTEALPPGRRKRVGLSRPGPHHRDFRTHARTRDRPTTPSSDELVVRLT